MCELICDLFCLPTLEGGCCRCYRLKVRQIFEEYLLYIVDKVAIFSEETWIPIEEIVVLIRANESLSVSFGGYNAVFCRHVVDEYDLCG